MEIENKYCVFCKGILKNNENLAHDDCIIALSQQNKVKKHKNKKSSNWLTSISIRRETRDIINRICNKRNHAQYTVIHDLLIDYFNDHPDKAEAMGIEVKEKGFLLEIELIV
jgi:hypothetical protein